jgi:hypothetical protein
MKNGNKLIIALIVLLLVLILALQASGYMTSSNSSNNSINNTTQTKEDTSSQVSQKTATNTQKTDQVSQQQNNPTPTASAICPVCNGKGYYTCPICHGTGINPQTGQKCEGGQAGCNGGIVHCYNCNGDGRMDPGDGTMM